jgi:hypothetical protein
MNSVSIIGGDKFDLPVGTVLRGKKGNASYQPGDVLQAFVVQGKSELDQAIFSPGVIFYTQSGNQTGFEQGQVLVSGSSVQSALLIPGSLYTIIVQWAPGSDPTDWSSIARLRLIVTLPGGEEQ